MPISNDKYSLPDFLKRIMEQEKYSHWIHQKANNHVKRDKRRGNKKATIAEYESAIHKAVEESKEIDAYTDEKLDWHLIGSYNNEESKQGGREYKACFALLPTVDHVDNGLGKPNFKICGWRTNDAKNDLSFKDFLALCKRVIKVSESSKPPIKSKPAPPPMHRRRHCDGR